MKKYLLLGAVVFLVLGSCTKDRKDRKPVVPVAAFKAGETTIITGGKVNFTDISTNKPTSWIWTFEGGIPDISTDQNPSVIYKTAGKYKVSLVAGNAAGDSEVTEIADYIIVATNPVASFKADVTKITVGDKVAFTDTSTNNPTSWAWTFEGGTPSSSTEQNPTVVYKTKGTYTISLVVKNAAGSSISEPKDSPYVTVNEAVDPATILPRLVRYSDKTTSYRAAFTYDGYKIKEIMHGDGRRWVFTYNGDTIVKIEKLNKDTGEVEETVTLTYDGNKLKSNNIQKLVKEDDNQKWLSNYKVDYTYDLKSGTISSTSTFTDEKGVSKKGVDVVYTLDATSGNLIKTVFDKKDVRTIEYDTKNNPYRNIKGYTFLLDAQGQTDVFYQLGCSINNVTKAERKNEKGVITESITYGNVYDDNNFLTKTTINNNGNVSNYEFVYDEWY